MNLKAVFFFLFSISLAYSFSVSMTAFPTNMTAGMTYQSQMQITSDGPFNSSFYMNITGVSASNEIETSMDGATCEYDAGSNEPAYRQSVGDNGIWICTYNQPAKGVYSPIMRVKLNELLDPTGSYSYQLDYKAVENTPDATNTPVLSYYSSTGGTSFPPRAYVKPDPPVPAKNETPIPTAQTPSPAPEPAINQTIEPTAQNTSEVFNSTDNTTINWTILPIELVEPEPKKEDHLVTNIVIGLFIVGLLAVGGYLLLRKKDW